MRKSPETTSKRTVRPVSGKAPCVRTTLTSASPPAQIAVPHVVELGVTVTMLLTVRGFTVRDALTGAVDEVSRTVSVTAVSAATWLGTTVRVFEEKDCATGSTFWSLEVAMYEPFPPLTTNVVGRSA